MIELEITQEMREQVKLIPERMARAHSKHKSYANVRYHP